LNELVPIRILLVEDNQDHADLIIDSLHEFNIKNEISHMGDGESAVAYLSSLSANYDEGAYLPPHLILLDIRMSKMDGMSVLKFIKEHDLLKSIPVIMISTSRLESEIENCYRLGANGFVTKPLKFDEFTRKIKEINHYWVLTAEIPHLHKDR